MPIEKETEVYCDGLFFANFSRDEDTPQQASQKYFHPAPLDNPQISPINALQFLPNSRQDNSSSALCRNLHLFSNTWTQILSQPSCIWAYKFVTITPGVKLFA
jgi:hypothetical protein